MGGVIWKSDGLTQRRGGAKFGEVGVVVAAAVIAHLR